METEQNFLKSKHKGFFSNLPNLKNGYTFSALYKIMQADVPIVIVAEEVTPIEMEALIKIRGNVCVISINKAWKTLIDNEIVPDFAMGDFFGEFDELANDIALILNVELENPFLKQHHGKQFFYWEENALVKYFCMEAQKNAEYLYRNNILEQFPNIVSVYKRAIYIAEYMNASKIFIVGADEKKEDILCNERLLWTEKNDISEFISIEKENNIECHITNTINELLPLLDVAGKMEFDNIIKQVSVQAKETIRIIEENINLYRQLYSMAIGGLVYQVELEKVVKRINECTEKIDKNEISFYAMNLANEIEMDLQEEVFTDINEIAKVANEGIQMSEKLRLVYSFIMTELCATDLTDKGVKNQIKLSKHYPSILLVYGKSQYNVLPNFVEGLKNAFQKLGYDVYLWDCKTMKTYGYNIYQNTIGYDYIVLMNGVMLDYMTLARDTEFPRLWYDGENTKVSAIFVDHPRRHADRLQYIRKNIGVFYMDMYWCNYIREYMQNVTNIYYLPIGGTKQETKVSFEEKENKVVFFGSRTDLALLADEINKSVHKEVIWRIINELIDNPNYTVEEAIRQIGKKNKCLYSMESLMIHSEILLMAETYIRGYFREKVVNEIAKSGIPFEIYGWRSAEVAQYSNVVLKEKVDYKEMIEICQNTRFVLNVQAWTKDGVQERVFNTMLGGSISVTDRSDLLEREFQDGENVIIYHLDEITKLPEKIMYYMMHSDEAMKIARSGFQIASKKHTWESYSEEMIEVLNR